eukprot:TRINITY_DN17541_c0_g1_i1.p1 TRINITY_DN17541_c0_g1~~TRINITY_DN17541_c0_g1_i1.p1  ORF type:complete len:206 (-),score=46.61 TRINITY_DN17541_c0_g1_i1:164-781(-)
MFSGLLFSQVSFPDRPEMKCMMLNEQPFIVRRETMRLKSLNALIKLHFAEGSMCKTADVLHCLVFEDPQETEENETTDKAVEMLRLQATKDSCCGQVAKMDLSDLPRGNGFAVEYAVVTGILRHNPGEVKLIPESQAAAATATAAGVALALEDPQKAPLDSSAAVAAAERKRLAEDKAGEDVEQDKKRTRTSQRRVSSRQRKSRS